MSIVSLDQARAHLRFPAAYTQDDNLLLTYIAGADDVMQFHCGDVIPTMQDEYYSGGDRLIYLRQKPVLSVEQIIEGWGWINWILDMVQVDSGTNVPSPGTGTTSALSSTSMFAYSIDIPEEGVISRRTAGNISIPFMQGVDNIHITYTTGRTPVPGVIILAELELIAHWWQSSQQRGYGTGASATYDTTEAEFDRPVAGAGLNPMAGVPYRILEMIRPYKREPIIG